MTALNIGVLAAPGDPPNAVPLFFKRTSASAHPVWKSANSCNILTFTLHSFHHINKRFPRSMYHFQRISCFMCCNHISGITSASYRLRSHNRHRTIGKYIAGEAADLPFSVRIDPKGHRKTARQLLSNISTPVQLHPSHFRRFPSRDFPNTSYFPHSQYAPVYTPGLRQDISDQ